MKKILLGFIIFCGIFGISNASTIIGTNNLDNIFNKIDNILKNENQNRIEDAIIFLHSKNITIFDNIKGYQANRNIRRDESAKMFYKFFSNVLGKNNNENTNTNCKFKDITGNTFGDLIEMVNSACKYNIFKGYNGFFYPNNSLTNAQAVVVLIRMIDGSKDEKNVNHYAENYISKANELGLLDGLNILNKGKRDLPASRGTIGLLLYKANQLVK